MPPTRHPPRTKAPLTEKSSFGGVVTPKLYFELREGARIGYSGPRSPRFSNNLPTAYLNPEVVTANLNDEVLKGRTMGPFSTPPFQNFKSRLSALFPKNILTNTERYFIYPTLSLGPVASIILLKRTISPSNILRLTMP